MNKNDLLKGQDTILRVLELQSNMALVIDCMKQTMPKWVLLSELSAYEVCSESDMRKETGIQLFDIADVDKQTRKLIQERFTMIASVLPFTADSRKRTEQIHRISVEKHVSKQTIRHYLCRYLVYQDISALSPKQSIKNHALTKDEKNMRWGLNKFFYTTEKNSLKTAYSMMLKAKYTDLSGKLVAKYPSFYAFRYFYRKHRNEQNYYISRNGLKDYQKNHRPLLGDGIQEYTPMIGYGMLDATICDIYLVNEYGVVGRPILVACCDGYSSLCCGYFLGWEGGTYSLRGLMLNIIADKKEYCKKHGIVIDKEDWNCSQLPATMITDMGTEYTGETFEQITDLGVTIVNLPAYRPDLKGNVEKLFDLVQDSYKKHLKGKGVIMPDFQERGARDYRKDACLTLEQFEKIVIYCILYYNNKRIVENYPFVGRNTPASFKPFASSIWNDGLQQNSGNLISVSAEELIYTLLPRTTGRFTRKGLIVHKLRYKHENYTELFLKGGTGIVAYNPDDVSFVWLIENGSYIRFILIESRYKSKCLSEVKQSQRQQKQCIQAVTEEHLQGQIDLAYHIEAILSNTEVSQEARIKNIRENRQREQDRTHKNYLEKGDL